MARTSLIRNGLVVSDNERLRSRGPQLLQGFVTRVETCPVADGLRIMAFQAIDLVLLDAGSRSNEMLAACERLAFEGKRLRVLAVLPAPVLPLLRLPRRLACDFVLAGASEGEIRARLRRLTQAGERSAHEAVIKSGSLVLDPAQHAAFEDGCAVDFTPVEYALFSFFFTHPDRCYSREELLERVWGSAQMSPEAQGSSRTVDVHVRRVRAKLSTEAARRLETVRGAGYLWRSARSPSV